jgi:rhomboid protease GluP
VTDTASRKPFGIRPLPGVRTRTPVGTIVTLGCWSVGTALYHLGVGGLFVAVRRDPDALAAGQWWRLLSPVLVQPDNMGSVIGLAVLAAVVGTMSERVFGTARWTALFFVGALVGHGVGEFWQPYSGGISVAFCGPLGALAAHALLTLARGSAPVTPPLVAGPTIILVSAIVLTAITDLHGPALLAGAVVGVIMAVLAGPLL